MTKEEFMKELGVDKDSWYVETNYEPMMTDWYDIDHDSITIRYDELHWGYTSHEEVTFSFEEYLHRYRNGIDLY